MIREHHQLNGHEVEQSPADGGGQEARHAAVHALAKRQTRLSN